MLSLNQELDDQELGRILDDQELGLILDNLGPYKMMMVSIMTDKSYGCAITQPGTGRPGTRSLTGRPRPLQDDDG